MQSILDSSTSLYFDIVFVLLLFSYSSVTTEEFL